MINFTSLIVSFKILTTIQFLLLNSPSIDDDYSNHNPGKQPPILKDFQIINRAELADVMKTVKEIGYNMMATTNAGRMQSDILITLVKIYFDKNPSGPPLYIDHEVNFAAYLDAMGLQEDEVPLFVQQSNIHCQDQLIEYRYDRVIRNIAEGPKPLIAITGKAFWKERDDLPDEFSYEDTLSDPHLKVINERVINYHILDFGDIRVYDEVEGIKGRPISGFLGDLFSVFDFFGWQPSVIQTRGMLSMDSLIVLSATSKFGFFSKTITATIYPDGHSIPNIPENRSDLGIIERRLEDPLEVEYFPYAEIEK